MFQLLLLGSYFYSSKSTKDENNRPRSSMNFDSENPQAWADEKVVASETVREGEREESQKMRKY